MGKLIKTHWARLIVLTAAACKFKPRQSYTPYPANRTTDQTAASLHAFFWPKILFDFSTPIFNPLVKPIPILQTLNLLSGLCMLCWEYPLPKLAGTKVHGSIEARLMVLPLLVLECMLMYQGTNAAIWYAVGLGVYWWGLWEGEREVGKEAWSVQGAREGRRGKGIV